MAGGPEGREPSPWFTMHPGLQVLKKVGEAGLKSQPHLEVLGPQVQASLVPSANSDRWPGRAQRALWVPGPKNSTRSGAPGAGG